MTTTATESLKPPGPGFFAGLGVLQRFRANPLIELPALHRKYGDILQVHIGPQLLVLLGAPRYTEHMLVTDHHRYALSKFYEGMKPGLGQGLLTSDGEHWLRQRRTIQPVFRKDRLSHFAEMMSRESEAFVDQLLQEGAGGRAVDLARSMMHLTFQIIGRALFGRELSEFADRMYTSVSTSSAEALLRATAPVRLPLWIPTPHNVRYRRSIQVMHSIVERLVAERRSMPLEERPRDFLTTLLESRDPEDPERGMSDQLIRDETLTFLAAGHETSANTLSWTWYLLARHPEQADRLREECRAVLQGRAATPDDLDRLPRVEYVIKESMRMFPPSWFMNRTANEDIHLEGYRIPRGTVVGTSQWYIHRDPALWDDPLRFDPDRFAPEQVKQRHRFSFFPFGAGQKMCIGENFAMLELRIILATLIQRLRFRLADDREIEPEALITIRPKGGVPVLVESV